MASVGVRLGHGKSHQKPLTNSRHRRALHDLAAPLPAACLEDRSPQTVARCHDNLGMMAFHDCVW